MVRLTRIYTRLGDEGDTHLGDMSRVRKTSLRVVAYGDVNELNSLIGVARAQEPGDARRRPGSRRSRTTSSTWAPTCACPRAARAARGGCASRPARWSAWSAGATRSTTELPSLTSFVLPAGSPAAAALHHARAVCRRAERSAVALADAEEVGPEALAYLNRLSDLLFILARAANAGAGGDVLWEPGEGR